MKELEKCLMCPHKCGINRENSQMGRCKGTNKIKVALVSVHEYEEPCISGGNGSGTIFFSNCNLSCKFCQNYEISQLGKGREIEVEELADIFIKQQEKGVDNINLVTPTIYAYPIKEAIKIGREKGLKLPIIYNSNGYENVETLKQLEGYVDVYLPDLKYANNELAKKYSGIENYFETATAAILEMQRQMKEAGVERGICVDERGIIQKGMIIRHLILPNYMQNTKHVLKWIKKNLPQDTYVSVMAQYFPTYKTKSEEEKFLNRKISRKEYKQIEDYVYTLELTNGYMQDLGEHEEEYVPKWEI